jgi:exo-poly-alpha-galacturonosidase
MRIRSRSALAIISRNGRKTTPKNCGSARSIGSHRPMYIASCAPSDRRLEQLKSCERQQAGENYNRGEGKIDTSGTVLFKNEMAEKEGYRGRAVCIRNANHVYLKDITVRQSPAWCVHLIYCSHISVNQVKIHTKYDENGRRYEDIFNGDGLNPDSSNNVYIFHSMIASQDDCIAIKSGRDEEGRAIGIPSQHIRISNCTFQSGFGIAVGSEMSGGVNHVRVSDCTFRNYSLEHEDCKRFRGAINIDQFYCRRVRCRTYVWRMSRL